MPKKKPATKDLLTTGGRDAQLRALSQGASKALENAVDLFEEAYLLRSHGAFSRALFLHQISLEECSKIELLGAWSTSVLMGREVDFGKLSSALATHKAKNYANAYMLPATEGELEARADKDWSRAIEAFSQHQATFHHDSNTAKNAALYVDHEDGEFSSPKEEITEEMVAQIAALNEYFLRTVHPKVDMLSRWLSNPDEEQRTATWFASRIDELKTQGSSSPDEVISILMREMRERAKAGAGAESSSRVPRCSP
jgi:AbiV family abortive infection protein